MTAKDRDGGESAAIIFQGASVSEIAKLFRTDPRRVREAVLNVKPCGERRGFPIYYVHEVAPHILKPTRMLTDAEMAAHLSRMNPKELPPLLSKDFWNALRARLRFEEEQGDLWKTEHVQLLFSETFKSLRMSLLLLPDELARSSTLSNEQFEAVRAAVDRMMADLKESITSRMKSLPEMQSGIVGYVEDGDDEPNNGEPTEHEGSEVEEDDFDL